MPTLLPPQSTDSAINQQKRYIAVEFLRYFPDATRIDVWHERDGEIIQARIWGPLDKDDDFKAAYIDNFIFECSSDDHWYEFSNEELDIITIPLESVA